MAQYRAVAAAVLAAWLAAPVSSRSPQPGDLSVRNDASACEQGRAECVVLPMRQPADRMLLQTRQDRARISVDEPASAFCCASAADSSEACGTCYPGAALADSTWCGSSEENCKACGLGAWCPVGEASVPTQPALPAPEPSTTPEVPSTPAAPSTTLEGMSPVSTTPAVMTGAPVLAPTTMPAAETPVPAPASTTAAPPAETTAQAPSTTPALSTSESVPSTAPPAAPLTTVASTPSSTPVVPASSSPALRPEDDPTQWVRGTWTTGYWDCCKPSCSWGNKGNVNKPVQACDAKTGVALVDPNAASVCQGGNAASCTGYAPFVVKPRLSMGFTAAAVGGSSGLKGDENCGQCFELKFVDKIHEPDSWGGSHPDLVGKSMVVQVINIGYDVTGDHSFDIQIPSAGQGIFTSGCTAQFPGYATGDFDCDTKYGGCSNKSGCARLPPALQPGCAWRYDWYMWLAGGGQTNNPYVDFRRVQCPTQLTAVSGSVPNDDALHPAINVEDYA